MENMMLESVEDIDEVDEPEAQNEKTEGVLLVPGIHSNDAEGTEGL